MSPQAGKDRSVFNGPFRIHFLRRFLCAALAVCLALPAPAEASPASAPVPAPAVPVGELQLPENLGRVEETFMAEKAAPAVYLIQDAHAVFAAQKNIAAILQHLRAEGGVRAVAFEGGTGTMDAAVIRTLPDEFVKKQILEDFMRLGELSGTAWAAAFDPGPAVYAGLEDWPLYEKNYVAFLAARAGQGAAFAALERAARELDAVRGRVYSSDLERLHAVRWLEMSGQNFVRLTRTLGELAASVPFAGHEEKRARYPEFARFIEASAGIRDSGRAEQFARAFGKRFLEAQEAALSPEALAEFHDRWQAFLTGQDDFVFFLSFLRRFTAREKIAVDFPDFVRVWAEQADTLTSLEGSRLMAETEALADALEKALAVTPAQQDLAASYRSLSRLRKLAALELSSAEYEALQKNSLRDFDILKPGESERFSPALDFYAYAVRRDSVFLKSVEGLLAGSGAGSAAVVAGGFHREALTAGLRARGIPYAVLTPNVESLEGAETYDKVMRGEISYAARLKNSFYEAFMSEAAERAAAQAGGMQSGLFLRAWRDNLLRDLAARGRLADARDYLVFPERALGGESREASLLEEEIRRALEAFRKGLEQSLLSRFELQIGQRPGFSVEGGFQTAKAKEKNGGAGGFALNASAGVDIFLPDSPNRGESPVLRAVLGGWQSVLPRHAAPPPAAASSARSELRMAPLAERVPPVPTQSGIDFTKSPPVYRNDNEFVASAAGSAQKTIAEIRRDVSDRVFSDHERMRLEYGFLARGHSPQARTVYEIFDRVVEGYNRVAAAQGQPLYTGKLFLVDSPDVNAFVHSEHPDVYLYTGLLKDMERYAARKGLTLTHEFVAGVLAHELSHVLQNSAYEGISFSVSEYEQRLEQEALVMKRNAEYDADRSAIHILTSAGYTPKIFTDLLQFLADITPESTAEHSFSDHPHPSLRLSEIMRAFNDSKLITLSWDEALTPFAPGQSFLAMPSTHWTGLERVMSAEDLTALEEQADTLQKILELGRLGGEHAALARLKAMGDGEENQRLFRKSLLGQNAAALAREIYNRALGEDLQQKPFPVTETGMTLQASMIRAEDEDLLGFEAFPEDPDDRSKIRKTPKNEARILEEILRDLTSMTNRLRDEARAGGVMHARKTAALTALQRITETLRRGFESDQGPAFDASLVPRPLAEEAEDLLSGRADAVLERMAAVPYSVYMNFGKTDLNIRGELVVEGTRLGGMNLERSHAALYRGALEMMTVDSPESRRRALDAALYSWIHERESDHPGGRAVKMLERLAAKAEGMIRELPEGASTGIAAEDAARLEHLRADMTEFIRSGKFPGDEDRLRTLMALLTSPPSAEGPAVFPAAPILRSPVFEEETGLGLYRAERTGRVSEVFKHQDRYLEIAGDAQRAAEILADDFRREDGRLAPDPAARIDVASVLRRNLQGYSPYFRKAVIEQFLMRRGVQKSLYPSLRPDRYRHQDVYDGLREMLGAADAHAWMSTFMNVRRLSAFEEDVFADAGRQTAFLEDYASFFETVLLPDRPEGSFLIKDSLAEAFLEARFAVMEQKGLTPEDFTAEEAARLLELLSRHTLMKIEPKAEGVIAEEKDHEPRLGRVGLARFVEREVEIDGPDQIPAGFFAQPQTLTAQALFQRFLELPLESLKQIARNQENLLATAADTPRRTKGRFVIKTALDEESAEFLHLLNHLLIRGMLRREGIPEADLGGPGLRAYARLEETRTPPAPGARIQFRLDLGNYNETGRMIRRVFGRRASFDRRAFWKEIAGLMVRHNGAVENEDDYIDDSSNRLVYGLFEASVNEGREPIETFADAAALMEESYVSTVPRLTASAQPVSYLKALSQMVSASGFKQTLFKRYLLATRAGPRSFVDIRRRPASEIVDDLTGNFLTVPSVLRDGLLDLLERQLMPELHRGSAVTEDDWNSLMKSDIDSIEWFLSKGLTEIPIEWMNLSENFPAALRGEKARRVLDFYDRAIPALGDPQRQLRFGAAALKLWRQMNPDASFQEELTAVERYFPKPTKLRDEALEELFNRHELPGESVTREDVQRAQELYSIYHRMIFEHETTNADAAFQAVQSMLTAAPRRERMQTALWILNPAHPMPGLFLRAKQEKNILFDELPADLRFAPEFMKTDMIMHLLTGENGILNPRTAGDREIKREFLSSVFGHFFPVEVNNPAETGMSNEALELLRAMFVFALDQYDQGRGAAIIDTLRTLETQLARKTYGERLAVLLGSLGPVGVKIGQILSENQELVPDARLRRDLASLKHGAQSISKAAVIEALIAAGLDPAEFRVGALLGSASMKQVHRGHLLVDGEWKEVVFKVLRPALNRTIEQDLSVLERMFAEPGILAGIRRLVPAFEPGEVVRKIRFMIEEERDFLREADNSRTLSEVVEAYPETLYQVRGLKAGMPKILRELPTVIVEERVRGLEAETLIHRGFLGRKARAKAAKNGLSAAETSRILAIPRSRLIRLARNHFFHQVFSRGIFHADPHAGNLMVEDGRLVFIDAGLIGRLILPEQVEAARRLVRGVVLWQPGDVFEGIRAMLEAGGDRLEDPEAFRASIEHLFRSSNMGSLNRLLNELGGLIARQPGASSAQAGAFIKAWTQSLWLMPMTPATLSDLAGLLNLSRGEVFRAVLVTGVPNRVLQPFRALRQAAARVSSLFQDFLDGARRKIQLYRASLRLRLFQDSMKELVGDFLNVVEDRTRVKKPAKDARESRSGVSVRSGAPLVLAGQIANSERAPSVQWFPEQTFKGIEGVPSEDIVEALRVYGQYAAFLLRGEDTHLFPMSAPLEDGEFRAQQSLWEFQGGDTLNFDDQQASEYVVRQLTRLYLARRKQAEGKPYYDLFGFTNAEQEYFARVLTEQFLNAQDAYDALEPLPSAPGGEKPSRRDLLLEKFPGFRPTAPGRDPPVPWLKYNYLDTFKPGSVNVSLVRRPRQVSYEEVSGVYTQRVIEDGLLPAFARSRQLRGSLKKLNADASYAVIPDRGGEPAAMVIRARERYTSRENPVTTRVEVHHLETGETVILHFTDAAYAEFLKTGRGGTFKRFVHEPAAPRSELRQTRKEGEPALTGLEGLDAAAFLLGREGAGVSRESVPELALRGLKRFQTVLAQFTAAEEERLRAAGGEEGLRRLLNELGYEDRLLEALTAELERGGFTSAETLRPLFRKEIETFIAGMRALLPAEKGGTASDEEPFRALTPEGRRLLAAEFRTAPGAEAAAAVLNELRRAHPGKYENLNSLEGILGTARPNVPWILTLENLQAQESAVTDDVLDYLRKNFPGAGLDIGVIYRIASPEETAARGLKQELPALWPIGARFGEPVKEGRLPAALRQGAGLYLLLGSAERFEPSAAGGENIRAIHVGEDVVMTPDFSSVEKIKINSLPLLNPVLEAQAPVLEGSRYRVINRRVFNFLVDLINDLARLQSVQHIISTSA